MQSIKKIGKIKKEETFPKLMINNHSTDEAVYLITGVNPEHPGVYCGICLKAGIQFEIGESSNDLSSSNLVTYEGSVELSN